MRGKKKHKPTSYGFISRLGGERKLESREERLRLVPQGSFQLDIFSGCPQSQGDKNLLRVRAETFPCRCALLRPILGFWGDKYRPESIFSLSAVTLHRAGVRELLFRGANPSAAMRCSAPRSRIARWKEAGAGHAHARLRCDLVGVLSFVVVFPGRGKSKLVLETVFASSRAAREV